ncbi:MAG: purine-nucleoside phosphorylase [Oscillospiraceae bacterium]|jgi:purine-nucleoside phosphorylase|nr:purine-nucleoside phosphorylase [Oscillospiraceae bacterium]
MSITQTDRVTQAAQAIEAACGPADVGIILGSGLGDSLEALLGDLRRIPYDQIPGFPRPTVAGHSGEWVTGKVGALRVAAMRGRFHFYEGHALADIALPVRVMRALGVKTLLVTNAAGGVNRDFAPGTLMLISDMINFSGINPLIGAHEEAFGARFSDMTHAFTPALRELAQRCAGEMGLSLPEGVYMWFSGPSYETPAEIRMARILGADAVGMSTVPEVIVASQCGMAVLGISCITNLAAGVTGQALNHQEVLDTSARIRDTFAALIGRVLAALPVVR